MWGLSSANNPSLFQRASKVKFFTPFSCAILFTQSKLDSRKFQIQLEVLLPPTNEVCEGYFFTGVCQIMGDGVLVSVQGGLCLRGVSVQGGLCPRLGLCPGGSLSWGVFVWGSLSRGVSVTETPCTVMSRQYTSYWNLFLFVHHVGW